MSGASTPSAETKRPDVIQNMTGLSSVEDLHQFFSFTAANFEASNYVCWACIQQYKKAPNKRKMIFIDQHFTTDTPISGNAANVAQDMTEAYKILKFVNLGADEIKNYSKSIGNQVSAAKAHKTFAQKTAFFGGGGMGAFKALLVKGIGERADAFAVLESDLNQAMRDFRQRFRFSGKYQMPAGTRAILPETTRLMTEATFDTRRMGVY